jgi:hypothetical protein
MAIHKSRVLTISALEYSEMVGKPLNHYEPIGVHFDIGSFDDFIEAIPNNVEVVVGYSSFPRSNTGFSSVISGTALIPKSSLEEKTSIKE